MSVIPDESSPLSQPRAEDQRGRQGDTRSGAAEGTGRRGAETVDAVTQATTAGAEFSRGLDVARRIVSELDLDVVLERLLEAARQLTGARYAALGVLDDSSWQLQRFVTAGIDDQTRERIGAPPRGHGVLGELIGNPEPLRLADVGAHPRSFGFPSGHPAMGSFLGVPVRIGGQPYGNLYLTEKDTGTPFTESDERMIVALTDYAGVAIDNARRYGKLSARRSELEHTVQALDATVQIARAVGGETDLEVVLELVAKRGRALVCARALVIEYERAGEMVVAAGAGELPARLVGQCVDLMDSVASSAVRRMQTLRLEEEPNRRRFQTHGIGRLGLRAEAGLVVPLIFHGQAHGVLIAVDRLQDGPAFSDNDQRLLEAFAASAATAVATAQSVESARRGQRLAAAEHERAHWARELHDETLQNLAALRLGISTQLRGGVPDAMAKTMGDALSQLDAEIAGLRSLISELRPAALDDLGVEAALQDLAERARRRGLEVDLSVDLAYEQGRARDRHVTELENAVYRITQEALTNASKHGGAHRAVVEIDEDEIVVRVKVRDDGAGFDPSARTAGFGLAGMHERAELLDGTLEVTSTPGRGTTVTAVLPIQRGGRARAAS